VMLAMDNPDTVVRIWPTLQTEPPVNPGEPVEILGKPLQVIRGPMTAEMRLPAGNYWVTAELNGREVHRVFMKIEADAFTTHHREEVQRPWGKVVRWVGKTTTGLSKFLNIQAAATLRQQEIDRLQGGWYAVAAERDGKALPRELVDQLNFRLIFVSNGV